MRIRSVFIVLAVISASFVACQRHQSAVPASPAQQLAWSSIVAGHTTGVVSRKSDVHIVFAADVLNVSLNAANRAEQISIEPAVSGALSFISARELQFTPTKELSPGQTYSVSLQPKGLRNVPQDLPPYEFKFAVQTPQFDVSLQGLQSDGADDKRMILRGGVETADAEDPANVEKMISAMYLKKSVSLQWTHSSDGLSHTFSIAGLERQAAAQTVSVKWNGQSIGSAVTGEQTAEVPARNAFLVAGAQAIETDGRKQILINFSDTLNARQTLHGMVRLTPETEFTTRIDNNVLTIYPSGDLEGDVSVTLDAGIRNERGDKLGDAVTQSLTFTSSKPQVRFVGKGVILPDSKLLSVPFEAVRARSVHVTAMRIQGDNVAQFLQVNSLDGNNEIGRVGRYLWRKTIPLTGPATGRWQRYSLDVTELTQKFPGGMFQLTLQIAPRDSNYKCDVVADELRTKADPAPRSQEDGDEVQASNWDNAEDYFGNDANGDNGGNRWAKRKDPCHAAYYQYGENVRATRNVLASNIGLLAKRDQHGKLLIAATDLGSADALVGAKLSVRNFQNQEIGIGTTDTTGLAAITPNGTPFLLIAEAKGQRGYLKLATGAALPVSHFDVGGEVVEKGLKGFIYGDRGVWRPGDTLFLTFVLQDRDRTLPAGHPVTLELYNPRGQLVQTLANTAPVGGFYSFALKTDAAAPTGDWTAKAILGGTSFSKRLKIETVMPNRLKVAIDLGKSGLTAGAPIAADVSAQWLSGASAAGLKADVKLTLTPKTTRFGSFSDFLFDDPAREFNTVPADVFEGVLDAQGQARFSHELKLDSAPPGMLSATFTTRVFEGGGAFSINRETTTYAPFQRFVGIRLPKGDAARDMLLTDQDHVVEIASLNASGKPVSMPKVQVTLYKVEWKWWWDKNGDSLAQYVQSQSNAVIKTSTVATANGRGQWKFNIKYPEWGRYLIRACDTDGGHCAGRTFYIDWPSWAGKEREQAGPAASVLTVTADKEEYKAGDTATIQLPLSAQGRALITIETGTGIVDSRWLEPKPGNTRFTLPITASMTPNVFVAVTLVQPHATKTNDRPLRLYGVIPLKVTDPATKLAPVLGVTDEWKPSAQAQIAVSEASGHPMTYTLAVVDEGLLSLTNFKTPDLYNEFFKREALGVMTWDLYDQVAGAYSAQLERLLALGGSDSAPANKPDASKTRFPPVVRFLGPFQLKAGAKATHVVDIPQYIGAVRVMLVAGDSGAYGSAEKSVFVRQPLMLLPTMPRVIGPDEDVSVPVSLFVTKPGIRDVLLTIEPDAFFQVVGNKSVQVSFSRPEEKLGMLRLHTANKLGQGHVRFTAVSGPYRAQGEIYLDVRSSNPPTSEYLSHVLQPGETWTTRLLPHGIAGTNNATLEVSGLPPLNLEGRLGYLIQYPHGCLEQTTSAVFPQLYLASLVRLEDSRKRQIEDNIRGGIERLRYFQLANGGFSYWPGGSGGFATGSLEGYELWATTYASHFLIEAEKAGYALPPSMRSGVIRHLRSTAAAWSAPRWKTSQPGAGTAADSTTRALNRGAALDQAYRLYVLALAGSAEIGAMNRLRELRDLPATETWLLAAAYKLAGLPDVASALTKSASMQVRDYTAPDYTFGSGLRDRAMLLHSVVTLGRFDKSSDLVRAISGELASDNWYSTQSTAYALMAIAKFAGGGSPSLFSFERRIGNEKPQIVSSAAPLYQASLTDVPAAGSPVVLRNTSQRVLFVTVASRGVPQAGNDVAAASGLSMQLSYTDAKGKAIDISHLSQGSDLLANVRVKNLTPLRIDNIALTEIVPAGWEIHNDRLDNAQATGEREGNESAERVDGIPSGSREATSARADYVDIRDDRVLQYFSLKSGESIHFSTRLNAAYLGRYYLPSVITEAMYDASKNARSKGQWIQVVGASH